VLLAGAAMALGLALSAGAALAAPGFATTSVNVRSGPGTQYRILDTLRPGQAVDIGRCSGAWCFVTKTGPNGWVNSRYLEWSSRPVSRPPVIVTPPPVIVRPPPIVRPPLFSPGRPGLRPPPGRPGPGLRPPPGRPGMGGRPPGRPSPTPPGRPRPPICDTNPNLPVCHTR
jgi:hypothetical protein